MNVWIRTGVVPDNGHGPCNFGRFIEGAALPARPLPIIDATGEDCVSALVRLAAVSGQGVDFAIASDDPAVILAAAAMGTPDIIVSDASIIDVSALNRIVGARRAAADVPCPAPAPQHTPDREPCLTVRGALDAGHVLAESDLDTAVTDYRGLGPSMGQHIVGLRLRYPVVPGEALHFGHFHDRYAARR